MFAKPRTVQNASSKSQSDIKTPRNFHNVSAKVPKNTVIQKTDEEREAMLKAFREKRKARFEELQTKATAQRLKRDPNNSIIHNKSESARPKSIIKGKVPVVKLSKACKLRIEKANPLLTITGKDLSVLNFNYLNHTSTITKNDSEDTKEKNCLTSLAKARRQENVISINAMNRKEKDCITQVKAGPSKENHVKKALFLPSNGAVLKKRDTQIGTKNDNVLAKPMRPDSRKPSIRRSVTSVHLKKLGKDEAKKCIHHKNGILKAVSNEYLSPAKNNSNTVSEQTILEEPYRNVTFRTPMSSRKSIVHRTPAPSELQERLLKWLEKRGKSLSSYQHLKCFGIRKSTSNKEESTVDKTENDENKENIEDLNSTITLYDEKTNGSIIDYTNAITNEDLFGLPVEVDSKDLITLTNDVLSDLYQLILEKYPTDQCVLWLNAIKRKYPKIDEQPLYWECKAALEEGEFTTAVGCYQEAIVRGAEPKKIEKAIDALLEKFCVLELDPRQFTPSSAQQKNKRKNILDVRNVFKTTVIQFAVQQKNAKKMNAPDGFQPVASSTYVATPVRRSTRLSKIAKADTPNVQLYKSLNEVNPEMRKSLIFKPNMALTNNDG